MKKYDFAIIEFTKVIEIEPQDTGSYYWRGYAYYRKGEMDSALKDLSYALNIDPQNARLYTTRALTFIQKCNYDLALIDANKAVELEPDSAFVYFTRARVLFNKDKFNLAIKDCYRAIDLDSVFAFKYYSLLGSIYCNKCNYDSALYAHNNAIEYNSYYEQAYICRGWTYYMMHKFDFAIDDFTKVIELNSNNTSGVYHRAIVYYKSMDGAKAAEDCEKGISLLMKESENERKYILLGIQAFCEMRYKDAVEYYTKAISEDSLVGEYYDLRGDVFYQIGDKEHARKDWHKAHDLYPGLPIFPLARELIRSTDKK